MNYENIPYKIIDENNITKEYKESNWKIAIGIQQTDNLKPSQYLIALSNEHIQKW
ncbi:MAG: hypothetical protein FWF57_00225 [Defluviitaleaceae bacterium]|nr:hypothetical protein [Defluviitaleaceae bacterium]